MARGSITKRGDSWTAVVDLPPDPATGKRRQKRITARTKKEVEARVAALLAEIERGGFADAGKLTVRAFFERWLVAVAPAIRPATARRYRDLIRLHIASAIGDLRLAKLTPGDLQALYAGRLAAGLSPTTVRHVHGVVHRALSDAVRWGLLPRNPCDAVTPPRRATPEAVAWTPTQAAAALAAAAGDDLEALWVLALLTGMRRGELLGLRWEDVDLESGAISVRRTLSRGATSRLEPGEPKTAAGRRRIALPASCVAALKRHRVRQAEQRLRLGPAWEDHGLVFTNATGGPLHPNTVARRFAALIERAGVPRIRFHDLRHTCATLLLAEGVHPKIVQERLGHADIAMTMNLYSHVTATMQQEAADRLDALIRAASRT